jgi:GNAT superfamily N-acetyltransferase
MDAIVIYPLTPTRLNDYLHFFDSRAFTDNANWSKCYCFYPYCDAQTRDWEVRTADENRASISQCIGHGRAQGYLAYEGNDVVGWCNAAPYARFPILDNDSGMDIESAGAIVCFVVCPTHRSCGIAKALLDAACNGLQSQGLRSVFAKPAKSATSTAENYPGPLSMYLGAGFSAVREDESGNVIVHKRFA